MINSIEREIPINGRLHDHYALKLTIRQEDFVDNRDSLVIRLKIVHDKDKDSKIKLIKNRVTTKLYINNALVHKESAYLDTTVENEIQLLSFRDNLLITQPLLLNIRAVLEVDDESAFIETTEITDAFILRAKQNNKLFIDLDYRESTTLIFCTVETTLEPDFLEYKTNFEDWTRLPDKTQNFSIVKNRTRHLGAS